MQINIRGVKFGCLVFNMGWQLGFRVNNWTCRIPMPIPLRWGTILYSLRHQGFWKTITNWFNVP